MAGGEPRPGREAGEKGRISQRGPGPGQGAAAGGAGGWSIPAGVLMPPAPAPALAPFCTSSRQAYEGSLGRGR